MVLYSLGIYGGGSALVENTLVRIIWTNITGNIQKILTSVQKKEKPTTTRPFLRLGTEFFSN